MSAQENIAREKPLGRRKARENAFMVLFSTSFGTSISDALSDFTRPECEWCLDSFGIELLKAYDVNSKSVDAAIEEKLKGWKVNRLPRVSLAVLRLAVAEMLFGGQDMDSIVINEAVEIAKRYSTGDDYQFINGVLGNISRERKAAGN